MTSIQIPISKLIRERSNGVYTLIGNELSRIGSLPANVPESIILFFREGQDGLCLDASICLARGKTLCYGVNVLENDDGTVLYFSQKAFANRQATLRKANEKIKKFYEKREEDPRVTLDDSDAISDPHVTSDEIVISQEEGSVFLEELRYTEHGKTNGVREVMRVPSR